MVEFLDRKFKPHPLHWVVETLINEPSYVEKPMFGCRSCYLYGRLKLALASRNEEPWRGLLIPTEKKYHESLLHEFPELIVHPVLGKWLYLREDTEEFEELASKLVDLIARDDPRIGVIPQPRKQSRRRR